MTDASRRDSILRSARFSSQREWSAQAAVSHRLTAYAFAAKWVARLPRRNAVTRFLGRVRRAMAYEG